MSNPGDRPTAGRARLAFVVSALLLALCSGAVLLLDGAPVLSRWDVPWPVFALAYLAFSWRGLEFVRKGESTEISVTQLPLALGLVLLSPGDHLMARLLSVLVLCAIQRLPALKTCVNVMLACVELLVAVAVVSLAPETHYPGVTLGIALLTGLILAELAGATVLRCVLPIVGIRFSNQQVLELYGIGVITSLLFSGIGALTLAAAWTEPASLVVVAVLAASLVHGYRLLRRRSAQQEATDSLHAFTKDLGPIDVQSPETMVALHRVRELLHAHAVQLDTYSPHGTLVTRQRVEFGGVEHVEDEPAPASVTPGNDLSQHRMRTPVVAQGVIIGLLTATQRLGTDRGFDLQDLRLMDVIASELATAFDRGRLVTDLRIAATRDPLTQLPNLRQTAYELNQMLQAEPLLLATVAVDSFREVNDTLGHVVGDELLCEVATRLRAACPEGIVGRIGGGRFAVAVPATRAGNDPALFGLGLRTSVEGGAQLGSITTHIRLSVGCARGPEHGGDASTLLRRAETAMYSARNAHGGPVIWEPAYEVQGQRRLAVVMALREAIASNAIGVAYQPKMSTQGGRVVGVEALARWTHPALGSITPDEFIPLAEASGLMASLTSSVLRQAVTACHGWQRRGGPVGVAVNVSSDTVLDPGFVTEVGLILRSAGLTPELLTLELTESVVVADPMLAAERMQELRGLGIRLSVDDFGTGYSSLTYLKGLPIDEVKIDKGFVAGLVSDPGDQAIVRAVVDIAHTLGMRVVAEGVEQADQHALLTRLGVDEVQGYLFARPMPALGMAAWIRRQDVTSPAGER